MAWVEKLGRYARYLLGLRGKILDNGSICFERCRRGARPIISHSDEVASSRKVDHGRE